MKLMRKIYAVIIFLSIVKRSIEHIEGETKILERILDYHSSSIRALLPPKMEEHGNESVNVNVSMFVRNFEKLDEVNMEMKVQLVLRMSWVDPRLSYHLLDDIKILLMKESIEMLTITDTSKVWIPDVFFSNEKQSHESSCIKPNSYVRIYPDGTVLYNKRISLTLSCLMNLKNYPHDSQICPIRLTTDHSTKKYVTLKWKSDNPFQVTKNIHLAKFTLEKWENFTYDAKTNAGDYSVLQVDLMFNREFFYYFKKFYLPVIIAVLISWIPLWLERILILRIYIAMSAVIFLAWYYTIQSTGLMNSYNAAVDIWNAANFIFVFLVALESTLIVFMIKTNSNLILRTHPDDNDEFKMLPHGPDKRKTLEIVDEQINVDAEIMKIKTNFKICFINVHKEVQIIDAAAKLFFPSAYVLFLFFYWITYY